MTTAVVVGTAASVLVAGAMMLSSIWWLRRISVLGNLCFIVYGLMITAWPVVATNGFICITNIYYLALLRRTRQDFSLVGVKSADDEWLRVFLHRYEADIARRYPGFAGAVDAIEGAFVLRNAAPVGLLLYRRESDGRARIALDYVVPGYRDFRIAPFLYDSQSDWLSAHGVTELVVSPPNGFWLGYFKRFGFTPASDGSDLHFSPTPST